MEKKFHPAGLPGTSLYFFWPNVCNLITKIYVYTKNKSVDLENETITGDASGELLGLDIDGKLNFNEYVNMRCIN